MSARTSHGQPDAEVTYELATDQRSESTRKYHIWTIGCQMNVADSNHVAAELEKIGYGPTDSLDEADVVVLNTCVVRQSAEDKAVGKLGSLKPWKRAKNDRTVALMGCLVGVKPSPQLLESYPYVDVFMPPSEATPLVNFLRQTEIDAEMAEIERQQLAQRHRLQDAAQPIGTVQSIQHLALSGEPPVAAHVPIVYGCSHACTFCIIPFRRGVERIRAIVPAVAIHTDIIVGFCGEDNEQFERTVDLLRDLKFDKVHLARYSPRPGTVSERRLLDDVPEAEKLHRHKVLESLQEQISADINRRFWGETVEVLVEDRHKGKWRGRNRQNKLVFLESDLPLRGRLVDVQITWTGPWSMQGRFVRDRSPLPDRISLSPGTIPAR